MGVPDGCSGSIAAGAGGRGRSASRPKVEQNAPMSDCESIRRGVEAQAWPNSSTASRHSVPETTNRDAECDAVAVRRARACGSERKCRAPTECWEPVMLTFDFTRRSRRQDAVTGPHVQRATRSPASRSGEKQQARRFETGKGREGPIGGRVNRKRVFPACFATGQFFRSGTSIGASELRDR